MATNLARRGPFADFADIHSRLDRLFEDLVGEGGRREWMPAIDVVKEDGKLVLRVDMPGIDPENVKIEVKDDILTVSGKHEETKEQQDKDFIRRERRYGSFSRSIALPAGVDPDKIEAMSKHGVLEVSIPMPEERKPKQVEIKPKAA